MTALTALATLVAAAAGGMLAGRAAVALDARLSGVTASLPRPALLAGAAGLALVGLAVAGSGGPTLLGAVAASSVAFAIAFLRGAVRIVATEERRERVALVLDVRRRAASRRRPAA